MPDFYTKSQVDAMGGVTGERIKNTNDRIAALEEFSSGASADNPIATAASVASAASGSTLGLEQGLLAAAGQPGLTVLAVGQTNTGKVQGVSLGAGNVVEVYENGEKFNAGNVLYREFMSYGEPICFTGLANGAIITSTQGFYGMSENVNGGNESPMPLLSYGLSFDFTFLFGFRNSESGDGKVWVVNGPLNNIIKLTDGNGVTQLGQEGINLTPWEFRELDLNGNKEYILEGTNPMMGCVGANMSVPSFHDFRLIMPPTNDGITWPRSGFISAPFDNTQVEFFTRDGARGFINSTAGTGVSPGSPVDFDAAIGVGTGANDADYEPNGATRVLATGLVTAYSGADSAGLEASPLMLTSAMSHVVAQPFFIDDTGDGGNSGVAIASPYVGTAKVYEWDTGRQELILAYTIPLNRINVTVNDASDQNHPCAGLLSNDTVNGTVSLNGDLGAGIVVADVPITVVAQNGTASHRPTIRSQNGTTTTSITNDDDETLMLGITPPHLKAEITVGLDGLLYKREIAAGGVETWSLA